MKHLKIVAALAMFAVAATANGTVLVQTSDPGYYNNSIGTALNNTNGGNSAHGYFPKSNDSSATFTTAPDLTKAAGALGNWLTDPTHLNGNWSYLASIPNSWAVDTEVAVIYQFNTLGATNVVAQFGVDNGIYVWLDGAFIGGARDPGGVSLGEYSFQLGDLAPGSHYLQLLLEDHGSTNGYAVNITADTFLPVTPVPEPDALSMFGLGVAGLGLLRLLTLRRRYGLNA